MRTLTTHEVAGEESKLTIVVGDEPGSGGANHRYEITIPDLSANKSYKKQDLNDGELVVLFQQGPVPEHGVNGVTIEALVTLAVDRLEGFQSGPFASADNQEALDHFKAGIDALHRRTRAHIARNVEGKEVA